MTKLLRLNLLHNFSATFFLLAAMAALPAYGQGLEAPLQRNCSAVEVLKQQLAKDPERAKALQNIEEHTARFVQSSKNSRSSGSVITIPVVVHVVYKTSTENISDAQIKSQLAVLNKDFRRTNTDADNTWSQAADVEIQFALATVDPNGKATTGITRTVTSNTSFNINDAVKNSATGGKDPWPSNQYLNIWVCNLSGNTLGYAQFPGGNGSTDGVVIGYKFFGTMGTATAPFNLGRTTTHEVGHWLNLQHIWGDGDCGVDDQVADTPLSDAPNYSCDRGHVSCNTVDMVQNYMDYSDDACMNLFTAGQKARMRALFASGGARAGLLNSHGLGGGTPPPACTAREVKLKLVLDNYPGETSWQLKNSSGNVVASGNAYTATGGTINETFCLSDGCYDFVINDSHGDGMCCTYGNGSYSLTDASGKVLASGGSFGATETKNFCLGGSASSSCPAIDFRNYNISGFADQDNNGTYQVQENGATLFISGNTWKQIPYNYTVTSSTVLEFEYRSTQMAEIQGIAFENDNQITPGLSFRIYGNQSWGIANYRDYSGTEWKKYTIPVGNFFKGNFSKLVFMGDDDMYNRQTSYFRNVKVYEGSCGSTRVSDLRNGEQTLLEEEGELLSTGLRLYPNPGNEFLNLRLLGSKRATAILYDITGKKMWSGILHGEQQVTIKVADLPAGIYTLRAINEQGQSFNHKFIKQ